MYLPKVNKKIASYLLGGGVVVSLATVGGLKLQDSVNYQAQVKKYAKVKARFAEGVSSTMKGGYLPTGQNEKIGEKQRDNYINSSENKGRFAKDFPTGKSFRDHCYRNAQSSNFGECTGSEGWCMQCARDHNGDKNLPQELLE